MFDKGRKFHQKLSTWIMKIAIGRQSALSFICQIFDPDRQYIEFYTGSFDRLIEIPENTAEIQVWKEFYIMR